MDHAEYERLKEEILRHFSSYEEGIDDLHSVSAKVLEAADELFSKVHRCQPQMVVV